MSGKIVCASGLVVALLSLGVARGQGPDDPGAPVFLPTAAASSGPALPSSASPGGRPSSGAYTTDTAPNGQLVPWSGTGDGGGAPTIGTAQQSNWILYPRDPGCCGPVGGNGPIGYELYVRSGVSLPVGNGLFGEVLVPGWTIEAGSRVLFFNPQADAAWTVDFSISNSHYNSYGGRRQKRPFTLRNVEAQGRTAFAQADQNIVIDSITGVANGFNQTFVNAKFGREWYLVGTATTCGTNWRWGFDAGGGWGTARADVDYSDPDLTTASADAGFPIDPTTLNIKHRTDVVGQVFCSLHSDIEIPCGCCIFQAGVRAEYGYTWTDILQRQNKSDLQAVNVLFQVGARY